jgi:hypothetical protein
MRFLESRAVAFQRAARVGRRGDGAAEPLRVAAHRAAGRPSHAVVPSTPNG